MLPEFTADVVTAISTTPNYRMGYRVVTRDTQGSKFWVYVRNGAGASLKVGQGAMIKDGSTAFDVVASTTAATHARFVGAAQAYTFNGVTSLFLDTYYGFVQYGGVGSVLGVSAGVAANSSLTCVAAGEFNAGTIGAVDLVAFNPAALPSVSPFVGTAYIKL